MLCRLSPIWYDKVDSEELNQVVVGEYLERGGPRYTEHN